MTPLTISAAWRRTDPWRRLPFGVLACLALAALVRVVRDFEVDALVIAALSILLIRVLAAEQRRGDEIGRKLDDLLALQKYGPLTAEDREVVAALRVSRATRSSPGGPVDVFRMFGARSPK
jgi:hypothetical protein